MGVVYRALIGVLLLALSGAAQTASRSPREEYQALNNLRVDRSQIYYVRELNLRRDVVRLAFTEGKLAFLQAYDGRITGAVFTGEGRVVAIPRDPVERGSLARFLETPLLDLAFTRAYLRFSDQTAEELLTQIRTAGPRAVEDSSFADDWDVTAGNLNAAHSLRILTAGLSTESQAYFYAGLASPEKGRFDVVIDDRLREQVVIGQQQSSGDQRVYDVWASFRKIDAPENTGNTFAANSYQIETTLLPDGSLEGTTTITLRALRAGERMVQLELSRFLHAQGVTDAEGRPLPFFQNEALSANEIAQRGNDLLFVVLPEAPRAAQEVRLRCSYRGSVISDAGNGVYFVGERGSWYPHVITPGDFSRYEMTFRWPKRLRLVATGKPEEQSEEGEWRTGRWRSETPIPVVGFNVGEYVTESVEGAGFRVELYANQLLEQALMTRFQVIQRTTGLSPPPVWPRPRNPALARAPAVIPPPMPPSPAALLKDLGRDIADSIRFYETLNGPFPFERLAVSPIPGAFGQGWPGLLYLSTLSFLSPQAHEGAGLGKQAQQHYIELMPFHEVAHQWWGNSVGGESYRDQWIHEGIAHYLALLYAEQKNPGAKLLSTWLERFRDDLVKKESGDKETPEEAGPLALGPRLRSSKTRAAFERVIYGKGPWVFHMLRMMLREPGAKNPDARFAQLLRSLVEGHRQRPLTTDELKAAVEELMTPQMNLEGNRKMDWFFDQWVRESSLPRYDVEFTVKPQGTAFLVRGKLRQKGVPDYFTAAVPLYVPRTAGKPALLGVVETSGPETPFQFTTRAKPSRILIDPNQTLLWVKQ